MTRTRTEYGATIDVAEIGVYLSYIYDRCKQHAVMFIGDTGVGKTQSVKAWADERGLSLYIAHPVVWEPVDVQGIPFPDASSPGKARFLPFADLWPWQERSVLFFDELNRAPHGTMNALLRVVLERKVGSYPLPGDTFIVSACNPPDAGSHVNQLSKAMVGRWLPFHVRATVDGWTSWAVDNRVHPSVISFINAKRDMLNKDDDLAAAQMTATPNPRNWAKISDLLNGGHIDERMERALVQAAVGAGAAAEFLAWRRMSERLPNPEDVLSGKRKLPDEVDQAWATAVSLAMYAIDRAQNMGADDASRLLAQAFDVQVKGRWAAEYATVFGMIVRKGVPSAFLDALILSEAWNETYGRRFAEAREILG